MTCSIESVTMAAEDIVDTTGAGDAFIGGFLVGFASGYTLEVDIGRIYVSFVQENLLLATLTASEKLRGLGSRTTLPTVKRLEDILKTKDCR